MEKEGRFSLRNRLGWLRESNEAGTSASDQSDVTLPCLLEFPSFLDRSVIYILKGLTSSLSTRTTYPFNMRRRRVEETNAGCRCATGERPGESVSMIETLTTPNGDRCCLAVWDRAYVAMTLLSKVASRYIFRQHIGGTGSGGGSPVAFQPCLLGANAMQHGCNQAQA